MSLQSIVFYTVGSIFLALAVVMAILFWRAYKYPVSENDIAMSNWFMAWLRKNKATFLLMFAVVFLFTGLALLGVQMSNDITDIH